MTQSIYKLDILCNCEQAEIKNITEQIYKDSNSIKHVLKDLINLFHDRAYFEANLDSLTLVDTTYLAYVHQGKKYDDIEIAFHNGEKKRLITNVNQLKELKNDLLEKAQNGGYPFAEISFQNLDFQDGGVRGEMILEKNQKIVFDEIKIIGEAKLSQKYLRQYLGIKKGELFSQNLIDESNRKLKNLGFINSSRETKLTFDKDGADVYLFISKRKASQFDLLFGFLPINDPLSERSIIVTTLGLIDLNNNFGRGENIYAKFEQVKPETQELELKFAYPYLFDSPFGLSTAFKLYRQDSAFVDINYNLGLRYYFGAGDYVEALASSSQTNVLKIDEAFIKNNRALPRYLDRRNNAFGIQVEANRLDYIFSPRRGWRLNLEAKFGVKKILENSDITNLVDPSEPGYDFGNLYNELTLTQDQLNLAADLAWYFPIAKLFALKTRIRFGGIFNNGEILQNEQFRIGGAQFLRGFDEQQFFADRYLIGTLEYRLLISKNTYGFVFVDVGELKDTALYSSGDKRPLGFGAGFSFDTNSGIFNISMALGKDLKNEVDFFDIAKPKIHLGYISFF